MAEVQAHSAPGNSEGIKQPYHLVDPSPWPLVAAIAAGLLTSGTVLGMHGHGWILAIIGGLGVLGVMFAWWRDVIGESVVRKLHTPVVKIGLRYGMSLFIASEVMFFVAFFWAFFDTSIYFNEAGQVARTAANGGMWPPKGIEPVNPFDMPILMTVILLLSGTTVTWAHHALVEGRNKEAAKALGFTILLGLLFSCFQAYEYIHAEFGFAQNAYTSAFFMATGFHGFHVIVGTIFLIVCFFRTRAGHFTPKSHFGFEAAAWYWHFVDVVWLFLFISIYWWGSTPRGVIPH
ncbi:cytochrome c oxidase subunit 3 [Nitrospirillum iridis]|uniref:Cytochrome c oxidase subunit 3 n=1 Tax=Nitrospirillum iridis TaxID=765888 RepID=A0A7X0ATC1_9PROT|nr:cytochrome c oxidase subunit 3 [Nitrospirillum iridis]MBB6249695.1 cytochrome c oxidase subunit 3 [Nitrospirillum iridis]